MTPGGCTFKTWTTNMASRYFLQPLTRRKNVDVCGGPASSLVFLSAAQTPAGFSKLEEPVPRSLPRYATDAYSSALNVVDTECVC